MINAKTAKETVIRNRKTIITVCAIAGGLYLAHRTGYVRGIRKAADIMHKKFDPVVHTEDLDILSIGVKRGADYITSTCFDAKEIIPLADITKDIVNNSGVITEETPVIAYSVLFKRN